VMFHEIVGFIFFIVNWGFRSPARDERGLF